MDTLQTAPPVKTVPIGAKISSFLIEIAASVLLPISGGCLFFAITMTMGGIRGITGGMSTDVLAVFVLIIFGAAATSYVAISRPPVRTVPIGVKILSVLMEIAASAILVMALLITAFAALVPGGGGSRQPSAGTTIMSYELPLIFIGVVIISYVAMSLWKGKNWARLAVIIFALLGVLGGLCLIIGSPYGVLPLVINAIIAAYLIFSKKVKAAFL